jgi:hypothetical protein
MSAQVEFERELMRSRKEEGIAGYSTGNPVGAVQQGSVAFPVRNS